MKHLLSMSDVKDDVETILSIAEDLKSGKINEKPLEDKYLGMIFEKSSTRTRVSFEVGMHQLGGTPLYLSSKDLQLNRGEPISDTARVLSRFLDCIMIRAKSHANVEELAKYATIPVISGLTDKEHPCQAFADLLTIKEYKGDFNRKLVFVGDGNNVCNSLLLASAYVGMDMTVACPEGYEPDEEIFNEAVSEAEKTGAKIEVEHDINKAVEGADILYTDVWVSMGDEAEQQEREEVFKPFQINAQLLSQANDGAIVMHCLPAIRDQEITDEVMTSQQSAIWDQAENRLHAQKAILYHILKEE
ncbi:MAG: ornithine carbamoyltransferase [Methanosphaera sp.]|uniref:ornithine carbamoyltransferase n=1 Tax=Methanosphaera sp. TaxID=2666342 RepID=UPI0025F017EB|nr:ornithine carbamoyltransferase [Methanosphaera sp.]MCI5866737.1 ornithine carbamoyltransferase [Methanosphaera sp.]MDD6534252.1 ornithine carbamoyltransferase [Methanosphaera sp.]MDY3956364.1 ornithine carbamoyltransferase [Methanosphaera sp.]